MNLEFGIPSKRKEKTDEYEGQSVLIMHKLPEGKKKNTKFELSKDGAAMLGYTKGGNIAISFSGTDIFLARVEDELVVEDMKLTNKFTFSHARVYNYIVDLLSLDPTKNNIFNLSIEDCNKMDGVLGLVKLSIVDKEFTEGTEEQIQEEYFDQDQETDNVSLEA
jgi:hypothetical protein